MGWPLVLHVLFFATDAVEPAVDSKKYGGEGGAEI
jgi:hypothetical protein